MKRSILLAICDFMILSALSLSSGVKSYHAPVERQNPTGQSITAKQGDNPLAGGEADESWRDEFSVSAERIQLVKTQREIERMADDKSKLLKEQQVLADSLAQRSENIKVLETVNRSMIRKNKELTAKINKDKSLIRNIDTIVQDLSGKNKELSTQLTEKTFRIDSLAELNSELSNENEQLVGKVDAKEKQIEILKDHTSTLQDGFKELEQVIVNKDKTIQQVKEAVESAQNTNAQLVATVKSQERKFNEQLLERQKLNAKYRAIENALEETRKIVQQKELEKKRLERDKDSKLAETLDELKRREDELTKLQIKLAKMSQGNGYVWEKYSNSSIKLDVIIGEKSGLKPMNQTNSGFLPEISVDGKSYLVGEFKSLGFSWSRINRNQVHELSFIIGDKTKLQDPILYHKTFNQLCLIKSSDSASENAVKPLGYDALLKRGLDDIYLFKRNGNSSELKCYFSAQEPGYVFTKNASSSSTTLSASPGDFLFTKKGVLIGVFVNHSKCLIIPTELKADHFAPIAVTRKPGEPFFSGFAQEITKLQQQ